MLLASDHGISQNAHPRHKRLLEKYASQNPEAKRLEKLRRTLASRGITYDATFVTNMVGNPVGGKAKGFAYAGSYGFSVKGHGEKWGLEGFSLFGSVVWRTGTSLSERKIGNQFPVQQVFGSQTVKLNEAYFMQELFEKRFVCKLGRLDAGNDFFASPLYWRYVNNGFDGNPISIFFNVPFTAYPNSTWGSFFLLKPLKRLSTKWGVYNANSNIKKNKYHGVNFTFKSTNGVILITEWCALVNQEEGDTGLAGNYKFGFFYLTGDVNKFSGGKQKGDPCYYILFDQKLYELGKKNLTAFISLIGAPKNRNLFPLFFNGGLILKSPFMKRHDDYLTFGYIYGKYSSDKSAQDRLLQLEPQNFESILELNYWATINKRLSIIPDIQYVIRPKGLNIPNALVLGAQISINL